MTTYEKLIEDEEKKTPLTPPSQVQQKQQVATEAVGTNNQVVAQQNSNNEGNVKTVPAQPEIREQASARVLAGGATLQSDSNNPVVAEPAAPKQMTYTDLHKEFYKPMTPEEKAAQQKRQRNRQIINAVGDGISALANLHYAGTSGISAHDPSTSLTKAAKERYDKLLAQQREDEARYKELAYHSGAADLRTAIENERIAKANERQDKINKEAYDKWLKEFTWKQDEANKNREERGAAAIQHQKNIDRTFEAQQKQQEVEDAFKKEQLRQSGQRAEYQSIKASYGKLEEFPAGEDPGVKIYFNVWKNAWPQVLDAILDEEYSGSSSKVDKNRWKQNRLKHIGGTDKQQSFVRAHWYKYATPRALMKSYEMDTPERRYNSYLSGGDDNINLGLEGASDGLNLNLEGASE